jgi:hypothetical protein
MVHKLQLREVSPMRSRLLFLALLALLASACSFDALGDGPTLTDAPLRLAAPLTLGEMTVRSRADASADFTDMRARVVVKEALVTLRANATGVVELEDLSIELADDNADIPNLSPLGARLKRIHTQMSRCQVSSASFSENDAVLEFRGAAPLTLGLSLSGHDSLLPQPTRSWTVVVTTSVISLAAEGPWLELPDVEFRDLVIIGRSQPL